MVGGNGEPGVGAGGVCVELAGVHVWIHGGGLNAATG